MKHTRIPQLRRRPARSFAAAVFVTVLGLTACGDGDSSEAPGETTVPAETTTATAAPSAGETTNAGATTTPESLTTNPTNMPAQPLGQPDPLRKENWEAAGSDLDVAGVRIGKHDAFDRVVFDLSGTGEPGWVVEYDVAPTELASGFPIAYDGNVALSVNLIGFNTPLWVGGMQGTGGVVNQVVPDKNHHGTSQFIIGLDQETPFSVTPLQEPPRLVVDILHEAAPPVPQPLGTPTREPKRQDSGAPHQQLITGVRLASHENFDRVVFDLVGSGSPGWITEFDAEPTHQTSAAPIDYEGSTALQVTLTGITPIAEDGSTQPLPDAAPVEGRVITEVVNGSIFEGHAQFVIGLEVNSPYSVSLLEDPQRVVVDVLHR